MPKDYSAVGRRAVTGEHLLRLLFQEDRRLSPVLIWRAGTRGFSGETFDGLIPSVVSTSGASWTLTSREMAASAESLTFRRVVAEPSESGPDAVLKTHAFEARTLVTSGHYVEWQGIMSQSIQIWLYIDAQEGTQVRGHLWKYPERTDFAGTVDPDGRVNLR